MRKPIIFSNVLMLFLYYYTYRIVIFTCVANVPKINQLLYTHEKTRPCENSTPKLVSVGFRECLGCELKCVGID